MTTTHHNSGLNLILACTFDGGIGYCNKLPWNIPSELKKFRDITTKTRDPLKRNAVIMGRKTWESIGRPLKGRLNIVLTTNRKFLHNQMMSEVVMVYNLYDAVNYCDKYDDIEDIFVIGGEKLYQNLLSKSIYYNVRKIILSVVFYEKYFIDTYIDMLSIYSNFDIVKDERYSSEANNRLFASFICTPKLLQQNAT